MNPKPPSDMVRQSLWVSQETLDELKKIAEREDRPVGWLIRRAVEQFVEREKKGKRS
jgi:predicted transcriptional regulator